MSNSFEESIRLNKYELDTIVETHANEVWEWGKKLADAKQQVSILKAQLDVVKSEAKSERELAVSTLDAEIRKNPKNFNLEKATDKSVESCVVRQDGYRDIIKQERNKIHKAQTQLIEAQHEVDIYEVKMETLRHRKTMIEEEIKLYSTGYFAKPSQESRQEYREVKTEETEERNKEITETLRNNPRLRRKK